MPKTPRRQAAPAELRYAVHVDDVSAHLFRVDLDVALPAPEGQEFWMPVWIPGSYLVREFSRHVVRLEAWCGDKPVALDKTAKNRWRAAACAGPLRLRYWVFAADLSVRAAYLDDDRAFFNASSLLLAVAGQEALPHEVDLPHPPGRTDWTVATTLPAVDCDAGGFGRYRAADYAALLDHPVEMGAQITVNFRAGGVAHRMAIANARALDGQVDTARLARDLKRICDAQVAMFEPQRKRAPFGRYLFQVAPTADGYGGLEHADSTALMCARGSLPHPRMQEADAAYREFLGLCSHEYFHAWNVKRIKPAAFTPYDLERENVTGLLWVFEGFTSYYDDLMLLRAGLVTPQQYLEMLGRTISAVRRTPGRQVQSLTEASQDAWIKYYRPDANTPNATVSYYQLGALLALSIDLRLRQHGTATLDDVMRLLWRRYGRDDAPMRAQGVAEDAMPALLREVSGLDWRGYFARHVRGTEELPLRRQLAAFGVRWAEEPGAAFDALGLVVQEQPGGWLAVQRVRTGGWAQRAGLMAGDTLLTINGERARRATVERLHALAANGDVWQVQSLRQDLLRQASLPWEEPVPVVVRLELETGGRMPAVRKRLQSAWMSGRASSVRAAAGARTGAK